MFCVVCFGKDFLFWILLIFIIVLAGYTEPNIFNHPGSLFNTFQVVHYLKVVCWKFPDYNLCIIVNIRAEPLIPVIFFPYLRNLFRINISDNNSFLIPYFNDQFAFSPGDIASSLTFFSPFIQPAATGGGNDHGIPDCRVPAIAPMPAAPIPAFLRNDLRFMVYKSWLNLSLKPFLHDRIWKSGDLLKRFLT